MYNGEMFSPKSLRRILRNGFFILLSLILLCKSSTVTSDSIEQIRRYTRMIEFDYIDWTLDALLVKNVQGMVNAPRYLDIEQQRKVVYTYLDLVQQIKDQTSGINKIFADPDIHDPDVVAANANARLLDLKRQEQSLKPLAESILQHQVSTIVAEMGLSFGGQPIPPVLYHSTPMPHALIISPRDKVQQFTDISLDPEMTTVEMAALEASVEQATGMSALVVDIGGVGIYPTMVMETTDLNWLVEVIAHEWTHNYLTLRPLGALYLVSSELRTINETTANISGKEISQAVIERYYPEKAPIPVTGSLEDEPPSIANNAATFNFNREMHNTRVAVDAMLAKGKVQEAESYMENRRRVFWEHGYQIRKLNQAYFAFYGAYNDVAGGGAAGADPVGPAVQQLRRRSHSLAEFINRIAWITSFEGLQALLK